MLETAWVWVRFVSRRWRDELYDDDGAGGGTRGDDLAAYRGFTMEQLMRYCIEKVVREELRKRAKHERMVAAKRAELENLARKYSKRVNVPYKFNRADAYPEGEFA